MPSTEEILRPFATEMRHLTSALNVIASDMIRDRALAKKLDDDPDYFRKNYTVTEEELKAMRDRNMIRLYELGLHPFLLVRFAGMIGILHDWQSAGAPGRGGARRHRHGALHPSACGPCRMEHHAARRPLGADVSQRQVSVLADRRQLLGRQEKSGDGRRSA